MLIIKNKLNDLADQLIKYIKERKDPFETITIIVPNLLIEQFFKTYFIKKTNSILMNVVFKRMDLFINEAFNINQKKLIHKDELSILISKELIENIDLYPEFANYLINNNIINPVKLIDLSKNLASLYNKYELDEFIPSNDQLKLFNVINENNNYTSLSKIIDNDINYKGKVYVFGFKKIEQLYLKALSKLNAIILLQECDNFTKDIDLLAKCSSKEREIEFVHSEICKLLKDENVKFSDIVVYASNLNDYEPLINKVFFSSTDDLNIKYPIIPYIILSNNNNASFTSDAINLLYNILNYNQFTRNDLLKLLTNSDIIKARNLDESKVEDIIEVLDNINVYRTYNEEIDDFSYAIKRLLLSILVGNSSLLNNIITIENETYLPYGKMSLDNKTLYSLISLIDDVIEFKEYFKNKTILSYEDLNELKIHLDKFLAYPNNDNLYYNKALKTLDFMILNKMNVSYEIIFLNMIENCKNVTVTPINMFTGGITFINFDKNNIVSSKYMFFVGFSNNNVPRKNINNELDLRDIKEDVTKTDIETFNMLLNNANKIYVSYTNINLQTLEDYFKSNLLDTHFIKNNSELKLLENREYEDLFSKRVFDKKNYNHSLTKTNKIKIVQHENITSYEYPSKIKIKVLVNYINENLSSKMKLLFDDYDDFLNASSLEYEPLQPSPLTIFNVKEALLLKMINKRSSELNEVEIDECLKEFKLNHSLNFELIDIDDFIKDCQKYYDLLPSNYSLYGPFNIIIQDNDLKYELEVNSNFIVSNIDDDKLQFNYSYVKKTSKSSDFSKLYIISLAYLASLDDEVTYTIYLQNQDTSFTCDSSLAKEILITLFKDAFDFNNVKLLPIDYYNNNVDSISFNELIKKTKSNYWTNFHDKNLSDIKEIVGFEKDNFNLIFNDHIEYLKKYVLFMKVSKEEK